MNPKDLFLGVEALIDGVLNEVIIHIENESKKSYMGERVFEYLCYGWLLKKKYPLQILW